MATDTTGDHDAAWAEDAGLKCSMFYVMCALEYDTVPVLRSVKIALMQAVVYDQDHDELGMCVQA